jgi:drug/metabolite transporter (DMT)-like permease
LQHSPQSRPLDALAITMAVGLCLTWGFNQVAVKLAIHDIPPLMQAAVRSVIAAPCVAGYAWLRGVPLLKRDGTLWAGVAAGILFAAEFLLLYRGLLWTTATRTVLFLYFAPFLVALGSRWFIPSDRFHPLQWVGLVMSFIGILIAFGLPTPAADPHQMLGDLMAIGGAVAWGATTLVIKASALNRVAPRRPCSTSSSSQFRSWPSRRSAMPSGLAISALLYQAVWVVSVTYVIWFALIVRYSAARLSAFTFLTPIFGVAAGYLVLNEPLTPAFALAVAFVAVGLVLVNRPR